jgi:hypothetical protein
MPEIDTWLAVSRTHPGGNDPNAHRRHGDADAESDSRSATGNDRCFTQKFAGL